MSAIERSSFLKHEETEYVRQLNCLLQELTRQECRSPGLFSEDIIKLKKQLEVLDTERYKGAIWCDPV